MSWYILSALEIFDRKSCKSSILILLKVIFGCIIRKTNMSVGKHVKWRLSTYTNDTSLNHFSVVLCVGTDNITLVFETAIHQLPHHTPLNQLPGEKRDQLSFLKSLQGIPFHSNENSSNYPQVLGNSSLNILSFFQASCYLTVDNLHLLSYCHTG